MTIKKSSIYSALLLISAGFFFNVNAHDDAKLRDLDSVLGGLEVEKNGIVRDVMTVNGDIVLTKVTVERNVTTNNGDILFTQGTLVKGDLIIKKSGDWFSGLSSSNDISVVEIDATSSVVGTIHLYKEVKLKIDENAKVGNIEYHYPRK